MYHIHYCWLLRCTIMSAIYVFTVSSYVWVLNGTAILRGPCSVVMLLVCLNVLCSAVLDICTFLRAFIRCEISCKGFATPFGCVTHNTDLTYRDNN